MWGWYDMGGWDWFWMSFTMTIWLLVLGVVAYIAVRLGSGGDDDARSSTATIASTMIGTPSGDGPCPGAERACPARLAPELDRPF